MATGVSLRFIFFVKLLFFNAVFSTQNQKQYQSFVPENLPQSLKDYIFQEEPKSLKLQEFFATSRSRELALLNQDFFEKI